MLQLYSFMPCEKVIFEHGTNSVSVIGVLHDIFIPVVRSPVEVHPQAHAPLKWTVFALWWAQDAVLNQWYEQTAILLGENGEALLQSDFVRFRTEKPFIRALHNFISIPFYRPATCWLKLYVRDSPSPASNLEWKEISAYPLTIHHTYYP
jgi:hypothetical protein